MQTTMTGNQFTFSNSIHRSSEDNPGDPSSIEYGKWAERIKGQPNYFGKPNNVRPGAWTRRPPPRPRRSRNEDEEIRWLQAKQEESGSGTPSPELWKREESPLMMIQSADSSPVRSHHHYSHVSHGSRAQTIGRYRQEMLDLVRDVPETAYELSLRDLVESPKMTTPLQETVEENPEEGRVEKKTNKEKKGKKESVRRRITRSESMDTGGGFFLRMFIPRLPRFLGGKRRGDGSSETCAKVTPKPTLGDGERSGSEKSSADREWWRAEFGPMTGSSGSSSSATSSGSSSSRKLRGCYSFFRTR